MYAKLTMVPPQLNNEHDEAPWLVGGYARQETRRVADRHSHQRGQILGIMAGVMGLRTDKDYWLIGPGQALWLPPGLPHTASSHGAVGGWSLYVGLQRCGDLPSAPFLVQGTPLMNAQADRLSRMTFEGLWNPPLARLAETFWDEFLSRPHATLSLPLPSDRRLRRVAEALSEHPGDPRSQEAWAGFAGMSLRSFVRHFSGETGLPFSVWRQRVRILNAQEQLARAEPVTEVALSVGYESLGAFASTFRRLTGYNPGEYSRLCRSQDGGLMGKDPFPAPVG
ncbi:MAG: helix-turn-helix transcriptional regulator [Parvibaculaceae bacterium]|nr:helix-turn-helix transcriptional regulator [Parvibaculaceae bacterium]